MNKGNSAPRWEQDTASSDESALASCESDGELQETVLSESKPPTGDALDGPSQYSVDEFDAQFAECSVMPPETASKAATMRRDGPSSVLHKLPHEALVTELLADDEVQAALRELEKALPAGATSSSSATDVGSATCGSEAATALYNLLQGGGVMASSSSSQDVDMLPDDESGNRKTDHRINPASQPSPAKAVAAQIVRSDYSPRTRKLIRGLEAGELGLQPPALDEHGDAASTNNAKNNSLPAGKTREDAALAVQRVAAQRRAAARGRTELMRQVGLASSEQRHGAADGGDAAPKSITGGALADAFLQGSRAAEAELEQEVRAWGG